MNKEKEEQKQMQTETDYAIQKDEVAVNVAVAQEAQEKEEKPKFFSKQYFKNAFSKESVKKFCKKYFIDAFSGMALGLFCTLIVGLIIEQIGSLFGENAFALFFKQLGNVAKALMGAGIGVGIAKSLKAEKYTFLSCIVAGMIGANMPTMFTAYSTGAAFPALSTGDPVAAYLTVVFAAKAGSLVEGKTKIDILIVPITTILTGALFAFCLGVPFSWVFAKFGVLVGKATSLQPIPMGIIIALIMGIVLTLPTSSAAFAAILFSGTGAGIGLAGGAAVAGCCAHMIGFAVASFRENKLQGLIAQGVGTSMLQIPNLAKNIRIMIPAIVASVVVGPLSTAVFGLECFSAAAGMGTSGFVGVIQTGVASMTAGVAMWKVILGISLCHFILPAVIAFGVSELLRHIKWIKPNDMLLSY